MYTAVGTATIERSDAAQAMGYKPGSGAANSRVGSLTHFGLLTRNGANYHVSELARRIIEPQSEGEQREAIAEAAIEPSLYAELVTELDGNPLPPMLPNMLSRSYGVLNKIAQQVADRFKETLDFAGLLSGGKVRATLQRGTSDANTASPGSERLSERDDSGEPRPRPSGAAPLTETPSSDTYQIPLTKGRRASLLLPRPLFDYDIERITSWIALMSDVLKEDPDDKE